jgi:hypothetical protein
MKFFGGGAIVHFLHFRWRLGGENRNKIETERII